jgi:sugar phosphate isomerase/epimerase
MSRITPALQLYTVRDLTRTDFAGTVKQVAAIGYRYVELAGFGNLKTAAEVRDALGEAGLKLAAAHAGIEQLEKELDKVLDEQEILGYRTIVCPYMPEPRRKDAAGWRKCAADLSRIGQQCRRRGFELAYHNHSFEFQVFDGVSGLDLLWQHSDPQFVRAELDVYWVAHGGGDPVSYIEKLGSRILLLHLKDMAAGPERRFAEVGAGILDFKAILAAAERQGIRWGVVEQDNCYGTPPLEAARKSLENLQRLGVG